MQKSAKVNLETLQDLEKFITSEKNPKYFFTMTEIDKIGINPKSQYSTPLGVYCYPLTKDYYTYLLSGGLPFAGEQPHIQLFTLNVPTFNLTDYTEEKLKADTNIIKKMYGVDGDFVWEAFNNAHKSNAISKFWNLTRLVSKNALKWNSLLRNLGYTNFYDPGTGTIHGNEPTQAVILDPSIIVHLGSFYNKNPNLSKHNKRRQLIDQIPKEKYLKPEDLDKFNIQDLLFFSQKTTRSDLLAKLFELYPNNKDVIYYLSLNPRTPLHILKQIYTKDPEWVAETLLMNFSTPPEILADIFQHNGFGVGPVKLSDFLAENPNTPAQIIEQLALTVKDGWTMRKLLKNLNWNNSEARNNLVKKYQQQEGTTSIANLNSLILKFAIKYLYIS